MFWSIIALIATLVLRAVPDSTPEQPSVPKSSQRHETTDRLGRQITYYLRAPLNEKEKLPLVLYIGGSGGESVWQSVRDKLGLNYGAGSISAAAKGKARLIVVERRGVKFLASVLKDPDSAEKLWVGHPHRRRTSFVASSQMEELAKAKVYLAQGSKDRAVAPESFHALRAQLLNRGREVKSDFMDGADHSFSKTGGDGQPVDGWTQLWTSVLSWYLSGSASGTE